jgi:hypothetical protein
MTTPPSAPPRENNDEDNPLYIVPGMSDRQRRVRFLRIMLARTSPESPSFETLRRQLHEVEQANPEVP